MWTVYHACLDYLAVKVLFSCLEDDNDTPDWLDGTLASLLAIAHKSLGESPQQLFRCAWPLAVALLKVRDPIHKEWIRAQLNRACVLLSNVGLPAKVIEMPGSPESLFLEYSKDASIEEAPA